MARDLTVSRGARVALGAAAAFIAVGVAIFGLAGLLVTLSVVTVAATVVALIGVPAPPTPRRSPRPGPPVENASFRSYRAVSEALSWADVSPRHYDLVTRPLLTRLAAARLADRHRVDLWSDPEQARSVLGDDVWPWVDPARETSRDSQPPGVPPETLTHIVDRLENL